MVNEYQAEIERLRAENERLRKWLERIADPIPHIQSMQMGVSAERAKEMFQDRPDDICGWAELALAGEPAA